MFTALKHPIRRKIIRIINQSPVTYTEILNQLGIDNGLLNYHLENMRDLIAKNEQGKYSLSEFGKAAVLLTDRVEEAPKSNTAIWRLNYKQLTGILLIIVIGLTSLYGFNLTLLNQKNLEIASANQRLSKLALLGELGNFTKPANLLGDSGTQIVSSYFMSFSYVKRASDFYTMDRKTSIIVFYVPMNGSSANLELEVVDNVAYDLDLTLQKGNAWVNETWVKVGTTPVYNLTKLQSPVVWSLKTRGGDQYHHGLYETPALSRGWYTVSLFGPVTIITDDKSVLGNWIQYPQFYRSDLNSTVQVDAYRVGAVLSVKKDGGSISFAATCDGSKGTNFYEALDRVFQVAHVEAPIGDAVIPRLSITGESLGGDEYLGADIVDATVYLPKGSDEVSVIVTLNGLGRNDPSLEKENTLVLVSVYQGGVFSSTGYLRYNGTSWSEDINVKNVTGAPYGHSSISWRDDNHVVYQFKGAPLNTSLTWVLVRTYGVYSGDVKRVSPNQWYRDYDDLAMGQQSGRSIIDNTFHVGSGENRTVKDLTKQLSPLQGVVAVGTDIAQVYVTRKGNLLNVTVTMYNPPDAMPIPKTWGFGTGCSVQLETRNPATWLGWDESVSYGWVVKWEKYSAVFDLGRVGGLNNVSRVDVQTRFSFLPMINGLVVDGGFSLDWEIDHFSFTLS
jgi:hypothetical protein